MSVCGREGGCVRVWLCVIVCECVWVCACVRERLVWIVSMGACVCVCEREREKEREEDSVDMLYVFFLCVRERERDSVDMWQRVRFLILEFNKHWMNESE